MSDVQGVADRVVVVVGGTGVIGRALCTGFADAGAVVVPTSRNEARVARAVEEVRARGAHSLERTTDVTSETDLRDLCDAVVSEFGRVDVLVNSAGIHLRKPALETSLDEWREIMTVNLEGPFLACRVFGAAMVEAGAGRIINIGSMGSMVGLSEASAYTASKGGLLQLTRALAVEWAASGVTVNALLPGFFVTELNKDLIAPGTPRRRRIEERTPAGRVGEVGELVGAALFLSSESAGFVTGAAIPVDGGFLAAGI
jgi:2-deoxy-D-gluconate 3-dehydrogenase